MNDYIDLIIQKVFKIIIYKLENRLENNFICKNK